MLTQQQFTTMNRNCRTAMGLFSVLGSFLSILPWILLGMVAVCCIAGFFCVRTLYASWKEDFAPRLSRFNQESLSHKKAPHACKVLRSRSVQDRIASIETFNTASGILERNERIQQRFGLNENKTGEVDRADTLNMDHQRVDFWDFLWAYTFIVPHAVALWLVGCLWMKLRDVLHRVVWRRFGVRHPSQCVDPRKRIGQLLLEGTQMVQFVGKFKKGDKTIAKFIWTNIPLLDGNGKYKMAKMMTVGLDLEDRRYYSGTLDGVPLAPRDALVIIWFHVISANHVKLHAYANWATNAQESTFDAFQHRMSVTTTMYNYFGFTVFPRITMFWKKIGLSSDFHEIVKVFQQGVKNGVPEHAGVMELAKYSEFARFIGPLRRYFHKTFAEHEKDFVGVDPESLFIGTIMHSLDHTLMGWNVPDPLILDVEGCDPNFRIMAELGRFVRAGFVDDLPGLMFNKNYSNAPHPFYQKIYKHAATLNKKLADKMDCCIIK